MMPYGPPRGGPNSTDKAARIFVIALGITVVGSTLYVVSTLDNQSDRTIGYLIHAAILFVVGFLAMIPRIKERAFGFFVNRKRVLYTTCSSCGYRVSDVKRHEAAPGINNDWVTCPECGHKYNVTSSNNSTQPSHK